MILGPIELTGRCLPPKVDGKASSWVWGDILPTGQAVVRFLHDDGVWEVRDTGARLGRQSVPNWAEIRSPL